MDRHAVLRSLCTMSAGALKCYKSPKMHTDSISESVIFQNFLMGILPNPLVLAYITCLCASHTMTVHAPAIPTSTMMINLKSRSAPAHYEQNF